MCHSLIIISELLINKLNSTTQLNPIVAKVPDIITILNQMFIGILILLIEFLTEHKRPYMQILREIDNNFPEYFTKILKLS
mmetsp:Transcript_9799/g.1448  ORF Transcript_9799/g.1448 Transcript_9799/m.1448 type:complete len:81 (+) Transcript_9799:595-837(+)